MLKRNSRETERERRTRTLFTEYSQWAVSFRCFMPSPYRSQSVRIQYVFQQQLEHNRVQFFSYSLLYSIPLAALENSPLLASVNHAAYSLILIRLLIGRTATHSLCALTMKLHTQTKDEKEEEEEEGDGKYWGYRSPVPVYSVTAHCIESFLIRTVLLFIPSTRRWPEKMNERRKRKMLRKDSVTIDDCCSVFVLRFHTDTHTRIDCACLRRFFF